MADTATLTGTNTPTLPGKFSDYTSALYQSLIKQSPKVNYTPRSEAQLRDNFEKIYSSGYNTSVNNRKEQTKQNKAAIDADAAARGMGSSTWVTDAKIRQANNQARDIASLTANKDSTVAQQLSSALANQEANKLTADQFNASQQASALSNALSVVSSMYEKFKAEEAPTGGGSGGYDGSDGSENYIPLAQYAGKGGWGNIAYNKQQGIGSFSSSNKPKSGQTVDNSYNPTTKTRK